MLRGNPQEVLPRVWKEWDITKVCYEFDTEEYARERDSSIQQAAQEAGAELSLAGGTCR